MHGITLVATTLISFFTEYYPLVEAICGILGSPNESAPQITNCLIISLEVG